MAHVFTLKAPLGATCVEVSFRCTCDNPLYLRQGVEKRCVKCDRSYRLDEDEKKA